MAQAIIVMGVSGCGKSTVGALAAERLGWAFLDADDFHPQANIEKMRAGVPLTDADRAPWLDALHAEIAARLKAGESLVMACSALKGAYRDWLRVGESVRFVYLRGDFDLIAARLRARTDHFFDPALLHSQFEALEEPADAFTLDIGQPPGALVERIVGWVSEDQA